MSSYRQILTINCGSSSLKFALYRVAASGEAAEELVFTGAAERIGVRGGVFHVADGGHRQVVHEEVQFAHQEEALQHTLDWLEAHLPARLDGVGHRVVHGGSDFTEPQLVTDEVLTRLRQLTPLAPMHLPAQIQAIDSLRRRYQQVPQVVCFDTAFHRRMPRVAQLYGLPRQFTDAGLLRYGFHGLSYEFILSWLQEEDRAEDFVTQVGGERIIIAHLGNGASMAAIRNGQSVDTTMGLTPTSGLVMSTRSGDLDPGVMLYLQDTLQLSPAAIRGEVEERGGLLGVSGTSSDMRDLLARAEQDPRAEEAVALFCYNAKKHIGALASALGGITLLVFTGGIGEHAGEVRRRICDGMEFLGLHLDPAANAVDASIISLPGSPVTIRVIATNEELMIVRHTTHVLRG